MQQAQHLAHLILRWHQEFLRWHQEFGKQHTYQLPPHIGQEYFAKVAYFQARQLSTREDIKEIADEQIEGVFEPFYNEKLPFLPLTQSSQSIAHESLGTIARLIRQLLREDAEASKGHTRETSHIFSLPEGWRERMVQLYPFSVNLPQKQGETTRQTLRAYFAPLADMEDKGVGGKELMVSMNEDLLKQRDSVSGEGVITAYSPASFNFQLTTGEESLVTHILRENVTIVEVTLGDSSNTENQELGV